MGKPVAAAMRQGCRIYDAQLRTFEEFTEKRGLQASEVSIRDEPL